MLFRSRAWTAGAILLGTFAASACGLVDPEYATEGIVRFLELEGGCWVIEVGAETIEPLDLPEEFKIDGLRVFFEGEERDDLASICMVGPIVELLDIQRTS